MAATKQSGIDVLFKVDTDGGGSPAAVGGQRDVNLTVGADTIDATNKDNTNFKDKLVGRADWSISANGLALWDDADGTMDANLKVLWTAITTRASIEVEMAVGVGTSKFAGDGYCTQFDLSGADEDVFLADWTVEGAATLTLTEAT